jgi:hypothetical protein
MLVSFGVLDIPTSREKQDFVEGSFNGKVFPDRQKGSPENRYQG